MEGNQTQTIEALLKHTNLPRSEYRFPDESVKGYTSKRALAKYEGRDAGWIKHANEYTALAKYYQARGKWAERRFLVKYHTFGLLSLALKKSARYMLSDTVLSEAGPGRFGR